MILRKIAYHMIDDGLTALKEALDRRENKSISTTSILELASTKMTPPYAILFMASLEKQFLEVSPVKTFCLVALYR